MHPPVVSPTGDTTRVPQVLTLYHSYLLLPASVYCPDHPIVFSPRLV